ncbi:MAG: DNA directed DNA polymerase [Podoviridae sp. ctQNx1]|nr:MAG: DNA directed DNA polymerase [Podoviridae sp. ctQNx1]UOF78100.1 DNA directed DNA polymerase [Caudoviricetes sp.]
MESLKPALEIIKCSSLSQNILNLYNSGMPPGDSTQWPTMDPFYTVMPGQWTLITGVPSHGKSTWLDCLTVNMARIGWRFAIFSPEQEPIEAHMALLAEKVSQKPFRKGFNGCMGKPELAQAIKFIDEHYKFLKAPEDSLTIPSLFDVMQYAGVAIDEWRDYDTGKEQRYGIVIDPWNELNHDMQADATETKYICEMLGMMRRYARNINAHIFLVAHPKMMVKNPKTGEYPIPKPYDISGSAHWYNKADNCITVWRQEEGNITEIHVLKVRFRHIGKRGVVPLVFDVGTGTYADLGTSRIFCAPTHLNHAATDDF